MRTNEKPIQILLILAVSFTLTLSIHLIGILQPFENKAFDQFSRLLNPDKPPDDSILLIVIDQHSIDELSTQAIQWPWPRQLYAPIIEYTSQAKAIFIDILYTEPSSYGRDDDMIFGSAIKDAANVYLPVFFTNQQKQLSNSDIAYLMSHSLVPPIQQGPSFRAALLPIEELREGAGGIGNVTISPDEDGVYRRIPLLFSLKEMTMMHLVLPFMFQSGSLSIKDNTIVSNGMGLPLYSGLALLRYYRQPKPFLELSAAELLKAYSDSLSGKNTSIEKGFFKDKFVFIGLTAAGLYDLKPTATSSISTGMLIHATLLDNLLRGTLFNPIPKGIIILTMLVFSAVMTAVAMRYHSLTINLVFFCLMLLLTLSLSALLFTAGYYGNITSPVLSVVMSFLIAVAYSYATEGKERRFVKRAFSQYMDEKVVDYLLKHPELIQPGGQKRRVTVFFADIAGFTTIAEQLSAEDTANMLRAVLNAFTDIIIRHQGIIDKYIGDCVMAFWGSPYSTEKDEALACMAAVECMQAMGPINENFARRGIPSISMRIGLNTGDAIAGNLGSNRLFDYTVIGDTVNLASRLEGVNKRFGTHIIASEETVSRTDGRFLTRQLGRIEVKGKTLPVTIYEIIKTIESATDEEIKKRDAFEEALRVFYNGQIVEALGYFEKLTERYAEDKTALLYKEWCERLTFKEEVLTEQDFIIKMKDK